MMMNKTDRIILVVVVLALLLAVILFPVFRQEEKEDEDGSVLKATQEFLEGGYTALISSEALHSNLFDNYPRNDPFVLSIRDPDLYEKGHIPGAVNIPYRYVFTGDNLSLLPGNKQIVVYDDTGHRSAEITALLNIYGYEAVSLVWGMVSWTSDPIVAPEFFEKADDSHNFGVENVTSTSSRFGTRQGCGYLDEEGGRTA
jgi:rhodanese-related sulfurtransferase